MEARHREDLYRVYVTDAISVCAQQLGARLNKRYYDLIQPPVPEKSGDEIVQDVLSGLGLALGE